MFIADGMAVRMKCNMLRSIILAIQFRVKYTSDTQ